MRKITKYKLIRNVSRFSNASYKFSFLNSFVVFDSLYSNFFLRENYVLKQTCSRSVSFLSHFCFYTYRAKGVYRIFGVSRMLVKYLIRYCIIPGFRMFNR